jgi:hypothetical protein
MKMDYDYELKKIKQIVDKFNATDSPTAKYALIQALNYICEEDMPIHNYWEDLYKEAMLKEHGVIVHD